MERVRGCLFLALACLGPSASALAATFTVNAVDERRDAAPGDGSCDADPAAPGEQCTLRAAVQEANATPGADTIVVPRFIFRGVTKGARRVGPPCAALNLRRLRALGVAAA